MPGSQPSFVMFGEWWAALSVLSDEQRGRLLQAVYAIHGFCEAPELDQATQGILALIESRMRANWSHYQETLEKRREAGRQGGLARASNAKQVQANASDAKQVQANASKFKQSPSKFKQVQDGTGSGTGYGSGTGSTITKNPGLSEEFTLSPEPGPNRGASAPESERAKPSRPKVDLRKGEFQQWYDAYPRHQKRFAAEKAWENAVRAGRLPALPVLLAALEGQRKSEQWSIPRFIPTPGAYLNAGQWTDDILPEAPPPPRQPTWPRQASLLSPEERVIEESRMALANVVRRMEQGGEG